MSKYSITINALEIKTFRLIMNLFTLSLFSLSFKKTYQIHFHLKDTAKSNPLSEFIFYIYIFML